MIHILNLNILESMRITNEEKLFTIKGINVAKQLEKLDINAEFVTVLCDDDYEKYQSKLDDINYTLITDNDVNAFGLGKKNNLKSCSITKNIENKLHNYIAENVINRDIVVISGEVMSHEHGFIDELILELQRHTSNIIVDVDSIDIDYITKLKSYVLRLSEVNFDKLFKDDAEFQMYLEDNNINSAVIYNDKLDIKFFSSGKIYRSDFPIEINTISLELKEALMTGLIYGKNKKYNGTELVKYIVANALLIANEENINEDLLIKTSKDIIVTS